MKRRRRETPTDLTDAERRALHLLADTGGIASRWPVGRDMTSRLRQRGFVMVFSEFVILTDEGREALAAF
jgi:hypothetical protein